MDFANTNLKDLACFIYGVLKDNAINAVLVGGACVSIYTHNRYQSYDLDFVTYEDLKLIEKVLNKYAFRRTGRCFKHRDCPYIIDFVAPPIAIGHEPIRNFKMLGTHSSSLQLLTPTDCIKDRLSSFFHWNDEQALEQAILVAKDCAFDLNNIKQWAKVEGCQDKLKQFLQKI